MPTWRAVPSSTHRVAVPACVLTGCSACIQQPPPRTGNAFASPCHPTTTAIRAPRLPPARYPPTSIPPGCLQASPRSRATCAHWTSAGAAAVRSAGGFRPPLAGPLRRLLLLALPRRRSPWGEPATRRKTRSGGRSGRQSRQRLRRQRRQRCLQHRAARAACASDEPPAPPPVHRAPACSHQPLALARQVSLPPSLPPSLPASSMSKRCSTDAAAATASVMSCGRARVGARPAPLHAGSPIVRGYSFPSPAQSRCPRARHVTPPLLCLEEAGQTASTLRGGSSGIILQPHRVDSGAGLWHVCLGVQN